MPIASTEKDYENGGAVSAQGNNNQEIMDYGIGDFGLEFDNGPDMIDD